MQFFRILLTALVIAFWPQAAFSAETTPAVPAHAAAAENGHASAEHGEEHRLPLYPIPVKEIGAFKITNSMIVTWIVALLLIIGAQYATRDIKRVPQGAQNFWEWLVEGLYSFLEGIIGHDLVRRTFWFFATIFIMILACNWSGLIPGVGSIGYGHPGADGHLHHISRPLLRGANADLNMTLAMAMIFFVLWVIWALQVNGPGGFLMHIFGPKGETSGFLGALMVVVFILVGVLEVVSIMFRPVSLSFRLFGNVFAGENMLESMATLVPNLGWLLPIPFYFMELLVGLVQALVFMLLTAVFTLLICQHDDEHAHGHGHGAIPQH